MKQKVKLSKWAMWSSIICTALLVVIGGLSVRNPERFIVFDVLILVWIGFGLVYMPLSVSVDDCFLTVHRPLWAKRIPLTDIEKVEVMQPTMGEQRLLGSGGFMGYWGRYEERDLGNYFAYYGRSSDCFLVRLRDGRQYMLGCENPAEMVAEISKRIS